MAIYSRSVTSDDPGTGWLAEIDLDPERPWLSMGTRSLGDRPWLVDDRSTLELRARLLDERFDEVCYGPESASAAVDELVELVEAEAELDQATPEPDSARSVAAEGLARLGRSVVEDFCLLRRGEAEWELEAGVVCFPSRWRLTDKLGLPLQAVHGPVIGYDAVLADRVTSLLDRLGDRVVTRRNWFVHPDPALFQPIRPPGGDPLVPSAEVLDRLFVRSERQTLRSLPRSESVVFTIATQQAPLGALVEVVERRERFVRYLREAPKSQVAHRGLSADQVAAVLTALTA